jgi:hypothetical protein
MALGPLGETEPSNGPDPDGWSTLLCCYPLEVSLTQDLLSLYRYVDPEVCVRI